MCLFSESQLPLYVAVVRASEVLVCVFGTCISMVSVGMRLQVGGRLNRYVITGLWSSQICV